MRRFSWLLVARSAIPDRAEAPPYDDSQCGLMVAICHNMDLGDSWEHSDMPQYPVPYTQLGMRIGVNYVTYAMTH